MQDNYINDPGEENFLSGQDKKNPFAVPVGYFDLLPTRVAAKMEIEEELKEFKMLSELSRKRMFSVPKNYFHTSENLLEYKYELAALTALSAIKKPKPENAKADYFAALDAKILNRLQQTDELKEYSTLQAIDKKNSFAVVPDYFDAVADRIKEKYHAANHPRVSVFEQILRFVFNPKIAVSFAVLLVVGLAALWNYNQTGIVAPGDCKTLACLEKHELLNEQTISDFDEENLYEMVDVESLGKQLSEETGDSLSVNTDAADSIKKLNESRK